MIKTGADLVAAFIEKACFPNAFVVNGGAAVFMIDALDRNSKTTYTCFQHEQSAAMAADAVYRVSGEVGVTVVTSGPGATNLITGIACSWFDSIPSMHITGQVNDRESKARFSSIVRQAGFQETDICSMVSSITKQATQVHTVRELAIALGESFVLSVSGRMGPVLIDVPMNVQQELASKEDLEIALQIINNRQVHRAPSPQVSETIADFIEGAERPLVVMGGGLSAAGASEYVQNWCESASIPYVSSWAGKQNITTIGKGFQGTQGVYGLRHANWCVQSADRILVLGSRLDNRQRTGNPKAYAPYADVLVIDIDPSELDRLKQQSGYSTLNLDLANIEDVLPKISQEKFTHWLGLVSEMKELQANELSAGVSHGELDPYDAFEALSKLIPTDQQIIADTGATLCWLYQSFSFAPHKIFTAGGNSPMGYALPAAIGAALASPSKGIVCVIGDGGFQMNIQELQTLYHYDLPISIIVLNNDGYGIIKQFQNSNTQRRYSASGNGYTTPDFSAVASAFKIPYQLVRDLDDFATVTCGNGPQVIEIRVPQDALVQPKVDGNRFLHQQFPYTITTPPPVGHVYPEGLGS